MSHCCKVRVKHVASRPLGRNLAGCSAQCSCFVLFSSSPPHPSPPPHTSAVQYRHTDTPARTHPICPTCAPIFLGQHLHLPKVKKKKVFQDVHDNTAPLCVEIQREKLWVGTCYTGPTGFFFFSF